MSEVRVLQLSLLNLAQVVEQLSKNNGNLIRIQTANQNKNNCKLKTKMYSDKIANSK